MHELSIDEFGGDQLGLTEHWGGSEYLSPRGGEMSRSDRGGPLRNGSPPPSAFAISPRKAGGDGI